MMRFLLSVSILLIYTSGFSQSPSLINAAEVIGQGKALYDSGKYKDAIARYLTISKRDTGYVYMLSELSLAYIANEEYEKALTVCEEGLKKASIHKAHFLRSQAIATDRKGEYDKAVALFLKGIESYPTDFFMMYNLGITYYNHKEHAKAVDCFFKVLSINPFHPGSHLNLGRLSAGQGKKTHAMLSFGLYLSVSSEDNERLVFLEKFLANQFNEEGSLPATNPNAFEKLDQIIRAKIAMDKNYKTKVDVDAAIVRQYQMLFDQLETASTSVSDPWSAYYLSLYKTWKEKDMLEPFLFHILQAANIDQVKKWHQKNEKKLSAFYTVTNEELKKKRATVAMASLGFDKPTQAWYYEGNRLEAVGNENDQGVKQGRWVYFKSNAECSAVGMYSSTGKKTGTWKYYHDDGTVSSIENYETGEVNVYRDGVITQHFFLKNDEIHGKVDLYTSCGALYESLNYDRGRRHGEGKTFYVSGKIKSTYSYDSNKVVGKYTNFFETGKIKNILTYKDDKLEGPYTEFYANGKCKTVGSYISDEHNGNWKYYHPNGRIESAGNYKLGLAIGEWNFYDERGNLVEKRNYTADGKFNGDDNFYYKNKIVNTVTYKNDLLISVVYTDTTGKVLGKFGHPSGTFNVKQYYPTGQISAEGSYKKGKLNGKWQYYFPEGSKRSEYVYEDGYVQGVAAEYFRSGAKKFAFNYKDGKFDNKFEEYFAHGQLKQVGWFSEGDRQQQWLSYYPDGVIESDYYYLNGELNGLCLDYNAAGKLSSASEYEADEVKDILIYSAKGEVITSKAEKSKQVNFETKYKSGTTQSRYETSCGSYTNISKWFPDGKIFYSYNLLSGKKEGDYQFNALNGKTLLQGNYIDGVEEGVWKGYYESGVLDYVGTYLSGKHDSTWTYHYPNGKISSVVDFREGERNGVTRYFSPDGTPLLEKLFFEGDLIAYRKCSAGDAMWTTFTNNTTITLTYPDGKKAYEETYKNGLVTGPKRIYYGNGNLYSEYIYASGDYNGAYAVYHLNGKVMEKGTYEKDELHGVVEKFNEDGTLLSTEHFVMGERHGKTILYKKGQKEREYNFYGGLPYE